MKITDNALDAALRDILNRYDRPREITQDDALAQIKQVFAQEGYVRPTALWLAFYKAQEGLMTREEWELSKR